MRRLVISLCFLLASVPLFSRVDRGLMEELDGYLEHRDTYDAVKQERIGTARRLLEQSRGTEARFNACMNVADEFFPYSFDSTLFYLRKALDIAGDNRTLAAVAGVRLGYLYVKSGHYMEGYERLYLMADTLSLSPAQMAGYYFALFEFSRDISGNSGMVETLSIPDRKVYRDRLLRMLPQDSELWRRLKMDELVVEGRYHEADSVGRLLLAMVAPQAREAAIYAYDLSDLAWREGRSDDQFRYLVMSAEADIVNAVKDYASLTILSQAVMDDDVDRAFHYLMIAQEDALFYNAKLRPWQISQFFMLIEQRYDQRRDTIARRSVYASILLGTLALMLGFAVYFSLRQTRRLRRAQQGLHEANELKEAYITKFLKDLSANVAQVRSEDNRTRKLLKQGRSDELLHALSVSTRADESLENFYRIFDETFLGLYPDFVQQMNSLLREDARLKPKKGELMNTELRIFALIRLGITDSREIASLLHYSLSTIYNYKVSVKNSALVPRDDFEQIVRNIGK